MQPFSNSSHLCCATTARVVPLHGWSAWVNTVQKSQLIHTINHCIQVQFKKYKPSSNCSQIYFHYWSTQLGFSISTQFGCTKQMVYFVQIWQNTKMSFLTLRQHEFIIRATTEVLIKTVRERTRHLWQTVTVTVTTVTCNAPPTSKPMAHSRVHIVFQV